MNGQPGMTIIETVQESGKSTLYLMSEDGFTRKISQYLDRGGVATARIAIQRTLEVMGVPTHTVASRIITCIVHGQFAKVAS